MRTVICGSRDLVKFEDIAEAVKLSGFTITEVISGGARGSDKLAEQWAAINGLPCVIFLPEWDEHGKAAGILRNKEMVEYAEALIAVWDGKSKGTADSIKKAEKKGIPHYIHLINVETEGLLKLL